MKAIDLLLAVLLDALIGDPRALPHPVVAIGWCIERLYRPAIARNMPPRAAMLFGAVASMSLIAGAGFAANRAARWRVARLVSAASALAMRSLCDAVYAVYDPLRNGDIERARYALGAIVGRDTAGLTASDIAAAAIESFAESLCDGAIAPLLALAMGGSSAAYAVKAASTLDSMVGHIEAPYTYLGRVAARIDDVANFIPARITALALLLVGNRLSASASVIRDARGHASPNAGWPEAAMAYALDVRLGGETRYAGILHARATFHGAARAPRADDIMRAMRVGCVAYASVALILVSSVRFTRG